MTDDQTPYTGDVDGGSALRPAAFLAPPAAEWISETYMYVGYLFDLILAPDVYGRVSWIILACPSDRADSGEWPVVRSGISPDARTAQKDMHAAAKVYVEQVDRWEKDRELDQVLGDAADRIGWDEILARMIALRRAWAESAGLDPDPAADTDTDTDTED